MIDYEEKALAYAERYGVIEYEVKGNKMTYNERFVSEGEFSCEVNLDTMKEIRKQVKGGK